MFVPSNAFIITPANLRVCLGMQQMQLKRMNCENVRVIESKKCQLSYCVVFDTVLICELLRHTRFRTFGLPFLFSSVTWVRVVIAYMTNPRKMHTPS